MALVLRTRDRKQENTDFAWTLAQVTGEDGLLLQIVDVSAVTLRVVDTSDPDNPLLIETLDPTLVFFSTPQLNRRWEDDTLGYNFAHYLGHSDVFGTVIEHGGHTYRLEYKIETTADNSSGTLFVVREVYSVPVLSGSGVSGTGQGGGGGGPPPTPDFSISVSPSNQSIQPGQTADFIVSSQSFNNFAGAIDLVATPTNIAGVTFTFDQTPIVAGGSTGFHIHTSGSTPPGNYSFVVTGTSGVLVHTANCGVGLVGSDFTLSVVPSARSISANQIADFTVTVAAQSGFNGSVALSATPAIAHITYSFTPGSVTPNPSATSDFQVITDASLPSGLYTIIIHAVSGSISHTIPVNVSVAGAAQQEWTDFTLDTNAQVIYVSNAGNDANDGLSPLTPKLTINGTNGGRSLIRNGFGDWLLLRKGDTFNESSIPWFTNGPTLNGSGSNRQLLGAYWDGGGTPPGRPTILTGNANGLVGQAGGCSNFAIVGVALTTGNVTPTSTATGIRMICPTSNLLIEDCYVSQFNFGITVYADGGPVLPGSGGGRCTNVRVRHNIVVDCWAQGTVDSSGIFLSQIDGLLYEKNFADQNGWGFNGTLGTQRRHNLYVQNGCTNVVVNDNVHMRSEGFDTVRAGGTIKNNAAINVAIGYKIGDNGADEEAEPAGVAIEVRGNTCLGGGVITPTSDRGWGMAFDNVASGVVDGNIIAHNHYSQTPTPLQLRVNPVTSRSVCNTVFSNNVFTDWAATVAPDNGAQVFIVGTGGPNLTQGVVFHHNEFQETGPSGGGNNDGATIVQHNDVSTAHPAQVTGHDNHYNCNRQAQNWFAVQGVPYSLAAYRALIGDPSSGGASTAQVTTFPNAAVDVLGYDTSIGGPGTLDHLIAGFRGQSRQAYDTHFTANAFNAYIRAGFGVTYVP